MAMTLGEVLNTGTNRLEGAFISDAKRDAESLLQHVTGKSGTFLFVYKNTEIEDEVKEKYFQFIDRRAAGEPVQYIIGTQEFMGIDFEVSPDVLIPRQDTETLVELALSEGRKMYEMRYQDMDISGGSGDKPEDEGGAFEILDMCCGSGAIAVSAAYHMPEARVTACDLSDGALAMTEKNAKRNGVSDRVTVMKTDMFSVEKTSGGCTEKVPMEGKFDMILSNPPYIASEVIGTLQTEVKDHEPMMALDGGEDGLIFYRILAERSPEYLKQGGVLILEIGHDQGQSVSELLEKTGRFTDIQVKKDLPGLDRVVFARMV